MKIKHISMLGAAGVLLVGNVAFAQNIQTNTTSTTLGSTQFGFEPTAADIEVYMELDTGLSSGLTCGPRVAGVMDCNSTAPNTNDAYVRTAGLPGSWTDSAARGVLNTSVNFACGTNGAPTNSNGCFGLVTLPGDLQTAPTSSARDFIGVLTNSVSFGVGATTAPNGFSSFQIDSGLATENTTIDQFIDSTVSLGGASNMVFRQRDATLMDPTGTTFASAIPTLAGAVQGDLDASLTGFTSNANPLTMPGRVNMLSRVTIDQDGADDPQGNFGGMNLDVQVRFSGENTAINTPVSGTFVTPGLNTGINPDVTSPFGAEWNGQAFP